jgi:hypothetical protein
MNRILSQLIVWVIVLTISSCSEDDDKSSAKLIVKIVVDPTQVRLGNTGSPNTIPAGNAGQDPVFNSIAGHYLELAPSALTQLGEGAVLYHAPETNSGGNQAIDFSKSLIKSSGEVYLEVPLKDITPGSYEWARLSLSYQNYDVQFYFGGQPFTGTIASFVGFNTFINSYTIKTKQVDVHSNKLQGYWGFESIGGIQTGQSPAGATTVPNPLFATSPIPSGSCVVTGEFINPLVITGNESEDITIIMSLSINKSFEWKDVNGNGKWDVDASSGEDVVDMGLRGLMPKVE